MVSTEPDLSHVRRMWADDHASRGLGIELLEVGCDGRTGWARTRMRLTRAMVNGHEIAHGGMVFALADSTFALACNAGGRLTVAAGCDINFVMSARLDDILIAEAVERISYGRSGITDVTVSRESDGAVVAEFRGRSRSLGAPATSEHIEAGQ